mgnify:CR=1 FL=1
MGVSGKQINCGKYASYPGPVCVGKEGVVIFGETGGYS